MGTATIIDRHGNTIDDDDIVPDGGCIRVAIPFMDNATITAMRSSFGDGAAGGKNNSNVLHDGIGGPAGFKRGFAFSNAIPFAHHRRTDHARARYIDVTTNAWRNPPGLAPVPTEAAASKAGATGNASSGKDGRDAYVRNLSTAWKTAT